MHTLPARSSSAPRTGSAARLTALPAAFLTAVVAGLFALAAPLSASAHDTLLSSDPAADSSVEVLPEALTLTFSAALIGGGGATVVEVTDAAGTSVTEGEPELDGAVVTQPLASGAGAGDYHVVWRVVSSDGHPISGEFGFTVTTGAASDDAEPSADPQTPATQAPAPSASETAAPEDPNMTSGFSVSVPWIIGGTVLALIVAFLVILMLTRRRRSASGSRSDDAAEG